MQIVRNPAQTKPCVLVLGMFDGVHRGHQKLLITGNALAEAEGLPLRVCTFSPHPLAVLCPDKAPRMLTTLPERARFMLGFGVDTLCVFPFTRALADEPPEDFVRRMARTFRPRHVVVGFNNTFGRGGRGDGALLTAMGRELGFTTHIVPAVELDGSPVSSTRIRALLAQGDIHGATRLLGHAYTLSGRVMDGKHIGRTMGYPTANVDAPVRKALPAFGVYACYLTVEGRRRLHGCTHAVIADRIVAATYLCAAAGTGGDICLKDVEPAHLSTVTAALSQAGCRITWDENSLRLQSSGALRSVSPVRTSPYPGFPTDAQAVLMAALLRGSGTTVFVENMFESRYRHVPELRRMGADIRCEGKVAVVCAVEKLHAAQVHATDLRGGAALIVAALQAQGITQVGQLHHIQRGYAHITADLLQLGAGIRQEDT